MKLFPASAGGPGCTRALLGPLPSAQLVPTGGIERARFAIQLASVERTA